MGPTSAKGVDAACGQGSNGAGKRAPFSARSYRAPLHVSPEMCGECPRPTEGTGRLQRTNAKRRRGDTATFLSRRVWLDRKPRPVVAVLRCIHCGRCVSPSPIHLPCGCSRCLDSSSPLRSVLGAETLMIPGPGQVGRDRGSISQSNIGRLKHNSAI